MNKEILNKNDKHQWNGYQEWYNTYNKIVFRGNFKNSNRIGYQELHISECTNFHII